MDSNIFPCNIFPTISLTYLNPILIYYAQQLNLNKYNNIIKISTYLGVSSTAGASGGGGGGTASSCGPSIAGDPSDNALAAVTAGCMPSCSCWLPSPVVLELLVDVVVVVIVLVLQKRNKNQQIPNILFILLEIIPTFWQRIKHTL